MGEHQVCTRLFGRELQICTGLLGREELQDCLNYLEGENFRFVLDC